MLNLHLADRIATRYAGRGIDLDDLVQVGRVGLVKAVHGYHPGAGSGFAAYAIPTITGEIKRHFRDFGWVVRPPRRLQELRASISDADARLVHRLHREASSAELAEALDVSLQEFSDALLAGQGYAALSLDAPARGEAGGSLADLVPEPTDPYELVDRTEWLRPALASLSDRQRLIVRLRFVDGLTQAQIGRQLGVSQMQVSRLLSAIVQTLRDHLDFADSAASA